MNKYLKSFLHRGLIFGGLGPIIIAIVYLFVDRFVEIFSLTASEVCLAIISTYILAFIQAGASIFNQIEHWPITKSLFVHFSMLYLTYVLCYIINRWIPFRYEVILIFTTVFVALYLIIWLTVYFSVRAVSKKMNQTLK